LEYRALEIELQHDPQDPGEARVHSHRKVQREHLSALEQGVDRSERLRFSGWRVFGVSTSWRTECAMHGTLGVRAELAGGSRANALISRVKAANFNESVEVVTVPFSFLGS
jgi:hypothetical protein